MGRPLIKYCADNYIAYPLADKCIPWCEYIHPNYISILCCIFKYYGIVYMYSTNYIILGLCIFIERLLDCLDGEVARVYDKRTRIGHYIDKYSDVVCRVITILCGIDIGLRENVLIDWFYYFYMCSCLLPFLVYVYDIRKGRVTDMCISKECWSIYIEDNSILLSIIIPGMEYILRNR